MSSSSELEWGEKVGGVLGRVRLSSNTPPSNGVSDGPAAVHIVKPAFSSVSVHVSRRPRAQGPARLGHASRAAHSPILASHSNNETSALTGAHRHPAGRSARCSSFISRAIRFAAIEAGGIWAGGGGRREETAVGRRKWHGACT